MLNVTGNNRLKHKPVFVAIKNGKSMDQNGIGENFN